uniref:beta-1,3-galactosyl-O-glycosyl-glycoprotein beta-1,6-N-acetylglucosaminyltransferase 7-like n=1 Tax=Pristiophorus japonicus TaxID=55135 RepID=UPI00398F4C34
MIKIFTLKWYVTLSFFVVWGIIVSLYKIYYIKDPIMQNGSQCNFSRCCPAIFNGEGNICLLGASCQKPETFQIQDPVNCSRIVLEHHFITSHLSQEEASYPLAYIITIHKELEMFVKLLRAIYSPQNVYCIHVDQKSSDDYKRKVKSLADCFDNIFIASKMEHVVYGGFSRLQADINCMKDLVNSAVNWKHVINLCGQDFPIKTNREIIWYIKSKWKGKNITPGIRQPPHMKYRTDYIYKEQIFNGYAFIYRLNKKKTTPPMELTIYFGSAYYALTREFVQFVLEDARAKALLEWSRDTYSPDEHYWVTLNRLKDAPGTTPNITWEGDIRAVKWAPHVGPSFDGCKGHYIRDICVYGLGDLKWIIQQPAMFANKFELTATFPAVTCMEQWYRDRILNQTSETIQPHWYLEE